jgi:hypothetical protein
MKTIYRYTVPVDDQVHEIRLTGRPVYVANGATSAEVEFWAEHDDDLPEHAVKFRVTGTGYPVPEDWTYAGTAPRTREGLVWHLYSWPAKAVVKS